MAGKFFAQIRAQWMGALALFLVIAGGTAYAADTIGSSDIIDESILSQDIKNAEVKTADFASNAVQTGKIGDNQIFSADVRDDTLANGGLTAADLATNAVFREEIDTDAVGAAEIGFSAVGPDELLGALTFDARNRVVDDDAASPGPTDSVLFTAQGYEIIARCLENPANTVKANIVVKSVGDPARVGYVDSNAPSGVNNLTGLAHGAEATLISIGPTTFDTYQTGQYAIESVTGATFAAGFTGNVVAGANLGAFDCRFQATAHGGATGAQ